MTENSPKASRALDTQEMITRTPKKGKRPLESLQPQEVTAFFLFLTLLFGVGVRLLPLLRIDFPLIDGGLFYSMIRDLQANHYALPVYASYNRLQIPYAYPPLAFYLTGLLNDFLHAPLLELLHWQPLIVNVMVLPVVYGLVRRMVRSAPTASLVTFLYAMMPNTYWWQVAGGGITRTLGVLLGFLTAYCALRMFQENRLRWAVPTAIGGALAALSHPEWILQTAVVIILFGLQWGRNRTGLRNALVALLGIAALSAPWWLTVLSRHGAGVFLYASQSTDSRLTFWMPLLKLSFTSEYVTFLATLAVLGIFVALAQRDFFLPVWILTALFIDPRGGISFSLLPFSILAAKVVTDLFAPIFLKTSGQDTAAWWNLFKQPAGKAFIGFLAILCLANAYDVSNTISYHALPPPQRQALNWIAEETEPEAHFLVLTGETNPLHSPLLEWFPALTNRHSITTTQGREWLPGAQHYKAMLKRFPQAIECLYADTTCLASLETNWQVSIDYVVLASEGAMMPVEALPLYRSLADSSAFELVYKLEDVKVFKRLP